jgi:nucleotide-binding universal stress UspA family protein
MSEPVILVPLDGSKQALAALPVAKVLGEIEGAALHIMHVGEHEPAGEELRSRIGRETPLLDDLTIDTRVGTPTVEILQAAREMKARLIVMCKHSSTERGKMLGRVLVVHVTDIKAAPAEPGSLTTPRYLDQPQHEWPAWSSEFVNRIACLCPLDHVHVRMLLAHGATATEVLRLSEKQSTDLIVLAWRGIWEAPRAATLKDILREAHCPIMVVRT